MAKRMRVRAGKDRRVFRNTAKKTKSLNVNPQLKRGGFRL